MASLLQKINELDIRVDGLDSSNLQTQITTNSNDISTLQIDKQDILIAGDNISIIGNTISSIGGGTNEDIGFLAYHNTSTTYSSTQKLPYNLVRYNSGNGYDIHCIFLQFQYQVNITFMHPILQCQAQVEQ